MKLIYLNRKKNRIDNVRLRKYFLFLLYILFFLLTVVKPHKCHRCLKPIEMNREQASERERKKKRAVGIEKKGESERRKKVMMYGDCKFKTFVNV